VAAPGANAATPVQSYSLPPAGTFQVVWHGNGHGHGLSQYGAYGASKAGLDWKKILAFYYPGTTLATTSQKTLRVKLSGGFAKTCLYAPTANSVTVAGHKITQAGYVRLIRSGTQFQIKVVPLGTANPCAGAAGAAGTQISGSPITASTVTATSTTGYLRLMRTDGTSRDYYGSISAVASGSSQLTVNTVGIDQYAQGVAPRESPASWGVTALSAQAVAARSYAVYESQHAATGATYDICDTPSCQVYGGRQWYDSKGNVTASDDPAAVASNKGVIVTYNGSVAFTQYSASNGGRTANGGYPYMPAKADPYDNVSSGDPYLNQSKLVASSTLASYFGFKTATAIDITQRDGGSTGYVISAVVYGTNAAGAIVSRAVTGATLQNALGLSSTYFSITPALPAGVVSYLNLAYRLLVGRAPSQAMLLSHGTDLQKGTPAASVLNGLVKSGDANTFQTEQLYAQILGRGPSASLLKARAKSIKKGDYLKVEARLFGSSAYYKRVGGTATKFVTSLYKNPLVLDRAASSATITHWVKLIQRGKSRTSVAKAILMSTPQQRKQARNAIKAVLGRSFSTASGERAWMKAYVKTGYWSERFIADELADSKARKKYGIKR